MAVLPVPPVLVSGAAGGKRLPGEANPCSRVR